MSTRQQYVKLGKVLGGLVATVLLVNAVFLSGVASGETKGDWWKEFDFSKYKGTTLRVLALPPEPIPAFREACREFEKVSGIKIRLEEYSYARLRDKVLVELMTGGEHVDLFWNQVYTQGRQFYKAGYYEPLEKYINDKNLTNPDWKLEDFFSGDIKLATFRGDLIALPVQTETQILFYRSDLLDKYGIAVPDTFDELKSAAEKLTLDIDNDGKIDIYGASERKEYSLLNLTPFLYGYGGDFFNSEGNVTINSPEAVQAVTMYADLLRNYGPPGTIGWKETINMFTSGRAALYIGSNLRLPYFIDPEISEIVGKFKTAVVPRGPVRRETPSGPWHVSISYGSRHKEAVWLALYHILSEKMFGKMIMVGWSPPYRPSWEKAVEKVPEKVPPFWIKTSLENMKFIRGRTHVPPCIQGVEVRAIIESYITQILEGRKGVQQALNEAAAKVKGSLIPGEFEWFK